MLAIAGCSESEKSNPTGISGKDSDPQAMQGQDWCPPAPTSEADCKQACGEVQITFSEDHYPDCLANAGQEVFVEFHYDGCDETVTHLYRIPTDKTQSGVMRTPKCKCCQGDNSKLVCARPGIWDDFLADQIASGADATKNYNLALRVWDTKQDYRDHLDTDPPNPTRIKCCQGNGYFAEFDANSNTVTVGCLPD